MTMRVVTITRSWMTSLLICASLATGLMSAQGTMVEYEQFYYDNEVYLAISPGANSSNPNQLTFVCFSGGPDLNDTSAISAIPFYVVLWSGGTHRCADGSFPHDHVATEIPGTPGFMPHWRLVFVIPVSTQAVLPLTSAAAVEAAAAAGDVVLIDSGLIANAPVVRRSASLAEQMR